MARSTYHQNAGAPLPVCCHTAHPTKHTRHLTHSLAPHRPMVACLMSRRHPTCWMAAGACCTRPGPVPRRLSRTPSRYVNLLHLSCAIKHYMVTTLVKNWAGFASTRTGSTSHTVLAGTPSESVLMRRQCCHPHCKAPQPLAPRLSAQYRQQQHQLVCLRCTSVRRTNRALTIPIPLTMPACAHAACAHAAFPNRVSTASLCSKTWTFLEASPPSPMSLILVPASVTSG